MRHAMPSLAITLVLSTLMSCYYAQYNLSLSCTFHESLHDIAMQFDGATHLQRGICYCRCLSLVRHTPVRNLVSDFELSWYFCILPQYVDRSKCCQLRAIPWQFVIMSARPSFYNKRSWLLTPSVASALCNSWDLTCTHRFPCNTQCSEQTIR